MNGQTPSEVANINLGLNGGNRWAELLNKAINQNYDGVELIKEMVLIKPKGKYIIKIFTPDDKEYDNKDKKFKTEFESEEKAKEFIEFYKLLYPSYEFRIEIMNTK